MAIKIAKPISDFEVVSPDTPEPTAEQPETANLVAEAEGLPTNVVQMPREIDPGILSTTRATTLSSR